MPATGQDVIDKIKSALHSAVVEEKGFKWKNQGRNFSVKKEKYIFLALWEFTDSEDESFTYTWYRFGAFAKLEEGSGPDTDSFLREDNLGGQRIAQVSEERLVQFFTNEISSIPLSRSNWYGSVNQFLIDFYKLYAPEEFQSLYLSNIQYREALKETKKHIKALANEESNTGFESSDYDEITGALVGLQVSLPGFNDLQMDSGLKRKDAVQNLRRNLIEYTTLNQRFWAKLKQIEPSEFDHTITTAAGRIQDYYDDFMWKLIACLLAIKSAQGPNADDARDWTEDALWKFIDDVEKEQDDLRKFIKDSGYLANVRELPEPSTSGEMKMKELTGIVSERRK